MTQTTETNIQDLILGMEQRMTAQINAVSNKIDEIAADVTDLKIAQAKTDERFNSMDQRFQSLEQSIDQRFKAIDQRFDTVNQRFDAVDTRLDSFDDRIKTQDNRFWGLFVGLFIALFGLLAKMTFFPGTPI